MDQLAVEQSGLLPSKRPPDVGAEQLERLQSDCMRTGQHDLLIPPAGDPRPPGLSDPDPCTLKTTSP